MVETFYRNYFSSMPGYVTVQDKNYRIIEANQQFIDHFGECLGRYCYSVYKNRDQKCLDCSVEKTFSDGKRHCKEEIIKQKGGTSIPVIVYTSPIKDENNEIIAVIEMSTDITGVKRLQDQYHALFNEVPCYISVQDRSLQIIETNRLFQEAFGSSIGLHCYKAYKHRLKPCPNCLVEDTFSDGKSHHAEEVVTSREGKRINVLCYTAPIRNTAGQTEAVMEMQTDITEVRQLQSKLSSIGIIVGSTAHDIKGLLGGLRGGNYLIETGIKNENMRRIKQGWAMVQRNLHRVRNMVLNLLYYSKDREVKWESIDIVAVVKDVYSILKDRAQEMNVKLELDVDQSIGPIDGETNAIHSLLMNLVENAIHACWIDKQKESHTITFSAWHDSEEVLIKVSDNGIGMDRETKEKAFSMFFSSKGSAGTGLGLFVAHKVALSHKGDITIESAPNVGTTFSVTLPKKSSELRK